MYNADVTTARRVHHSYADYVAALELSHVKLEYCDGEIYAMAGGTPAHADLAAAVIRLLGNALLDQSSVSSSDLKIRVEATDLSTFPDATVVCGERQVAAIDANAVTNPTLLVEVTSVDGRLRSTPASSWAESQASEYHRGNPTIHAVALCLPQ